MKRGFTYAEAMAYVGVKRRTFDEVWRPLLVAIPSGSSLLFDKADLDRVFEQFKRAAAGEPQAANDDHGPAPLPAAAGQAQNAPRNGRPSHKKGDFTWAKKPGASSPMETAGRSIAGTAAPDFASAVSTVMKRRNSG